ncbi:arginase family protein [bacterium]|nr:arginase family protein [bacterium]
MQKDIRIFAAGTNLGSFSYGAEDGPEVLLERGLEGVLAPCASSIELVQWSVDSLHVGAQEAQGVRNAHRLIPWLIGLRKAIVVTESSALPVVLGGDHSVAVASLLATRERHPDAVCVYIDAHPDTQAPGTSTTHNLHGMPVRVATGGALYEHFYGPYMKPQDFYYVAIKDIDQPEADWINIEGVAHATMDDVIASGIGAVMRDVRKWAAGRPIHVSFDIDSIDQQFAPGTGIKNQGGLTYREAVYIARQLAAENIIAIDLVEFNPMCDIDGRTGDLAIELLAHLLGIRWDSYTRYLHHE